MHTACPVIAELLGPDNMDGLAGIFLRAHPPSSPLMMHYGDAFPDFLAGMPQLQHLGYLPDTARLELALRQAYHAADADPIDPDLLAQTQPDDLMTSTIGLAPSVRVLRSKWPIYDIWRFNTEEGAPKPSAVAQDVLISRPEYDPAPVLLPEGGAVFVDQLRNGHTLAAAMDAAQSDVPNFDLGQTLALLLQGQSIISLETKD